MAVSDWFQKPRDNGNRENFRAMEVFDMKSEIVVSPLGLEPRTPRLKDWGFVKQIKARFLKLGPFDLMTFPGVAEVSETAPASEGVRHG